MLLAILLGAEPLHGLVRHSHNPLRWGEVSLDSIANAVVVLPLVALACAAFLRGLLAWLSHPQAPLRASEVVAVGAVSVALVAGVVALTFIASLACDLFPSQSPDFWTHHVIRRLEDEPVVLSCLIGPLTALAALALYGLHWLDQAGREAPRASAREVWRGALRWAVGAMGWGMALQCVAVALGGLLDAMTYGQPAWQIVATVLMTAGFMALVALPLCRYGRHQGNRYTLKDVAIALIGAVLLLLGAGAALGAWRVHQSGATDWNILIFVAPLVWLALVALALVLGVCGGAVYALGLSLTRAGASTGT